MFDVKSIILVVFIGCQAYLLVQFQKKRHGFSILWSYRKEESNKINSRERSTSTMVGNDVKDKICLGSKVSCFGSKRTDRFCRFRNLCFKRSHNNFVFFHGRDTFQSGLPQNRFEPAFADFSSVDNHNGKYFNFVDLPTSSICNGSHRLKRSIAYRTGSHLLMHRFKPDNLMHFIHDDLLPVFVTLQAVGHEVNKTSLVFFDANSAGPYDHLFSTFEVEDIIYKEDFTEDWMCFQDATVSVLKDSTWYQYGFHHMQGPLQSKLAAGVYINDLVSHVRRICDIKEESLKHCMKTEDSCKQKVLLLSRRHNRKILNEAEVAIYLASHFEMPVEIVTIEDALVEKLVCELYTTSVLVGMHGAFLVMSMFLQPNSTVVELFPFAVDPDKYTPYKTLAGIMGLRYFAWENLEKANSIGHPDWPREFGGIGHLTSKEQDAIVHTTHIPDHLCCNNPNWLYHIYQDTKIDTKSLDNVLTRQPMTRMMKAQERYPLFPAVVENCSCRFKVLQYEGLSLQIKWQEPWNIKDIDFGVGPKYHVWIKQEENIFAYETDFTNLEVKGLSGVASSIWIKCVHNGNDGQVSPEIVCSGL